MDMGFTCRRDRWIKQLIKGEILKLGWSEICWLCFSPVSPGSCELFRHEEISRSALLDTINVSVLTTIAKKTTARRAFEEETNKGWNHSFYWCSHSLRIHSARNHRKAWSVCKAQHLLKLHDLMTCQRFEIIGCFLHVATPSEEEAAAGAGDRLRKLQPFMDCQLFHILSTTPAFEHWQMNAWWKVSRIPTWCNICVTNL